MTVTALSRWLRTNEVAERLDFEPKHVRLLARAGLLPSLRVGARGHYRFDRDTIESLIESASWGRAQSTAHPSGSGSAPDARRDPTTEGEPE